MKKMDIFGYQVEIDEEATKEWYNKAKLQFVLDDE